MGDPNGEVPTVLQQRQTTSGAERNHLGSDAIEGAAPLEQERPGEGQRDGQPHVVHHHITSIPGSTLRTIVSPMGTTTTTTTNVPMAGTTASDPLTTPRQVRRVIVINGNGAPSRTTTTVDGQGETTTTTTTTTNAPGDGTPRVTTRTTVTRHRIIPSPPAGEATVSSEPTYVRSSPSESSSIFGTSTQFGLPQGQGFRSALLPRNNLLDQHRARMSQIQNSSETTPTAPAPAPEPLMPPSQTRPARFRQPSESAESHLRSTLLTLAGRTPGTPDSMSSSTSTSTSTSNADHLRNRLESRLEPRDRLDIARNAQGRMRESAHTEIPPGFSNPFTTPPRTPANNLFEALNTRRVNAPFGRLFTDDDDDNDDAMDDTELNGGIFSSPSRRPAARATAATGINARLGPSPQAQSSDEAIAERIASWYLRLNELNAITRHIHEANEQLDAIAAERNRIAGRANASSATDGSSSPTRTQVGFRPASTLGTTTSPLERILARMSNTIGGGLSSRLRDAAALSTRTAVPVRRERDANGDMMDVELAPFRDEDDVSDDDSNYEDMIEDDDEGNSGTRTRSNEAEDLYGLGTTLRMQSLFTRENARREQLFRMLSSHGVEGVPQDWVRPSPVYSQTFRSKIVCTINCKSCNKRLCNRGMRAILLADSKVELFSTDEAPTGVSLIGQEYTTGRCQCKVSDIGCQGCGNPVGYHVTEPCRTCLRACNNGHFWMFHMKDINYLEIVNERNSKKLLWGELITPSKNLVDLMVTMDR